MILKENRFLSFVAVLALWAMINAPLAYANADTVPEQALDTILDSVTTDTPAIMDNTVEVTPTDELPMFFSIQEGNDNDAMARKALEKVLKRAETEVGRHIPLGVARIDLNNDGILELFVRLLDQDLFCKADDCQVYGFAVTENGFIKIADLQSRTIDILNKTTSGAKDLRVRMTDESVRNYIWDGKQYNLSVAQDKQEETGGAE